MHSQLVLLPEQNVGMFVSYNSMGEGDGAGKARDKLLQAFIDRYYPAPVPVSPEPPADFHQRAGKFTGSYRNTRSSYTTFEKILNLLSEVRVNSNPDGTMQGPMGEEIEEIFRKLKIKIPTFDVTECIHTDQ